MRISIQHHGWVRLHDYMLKTLPRGTGTQHPETTETNAGCKEKNRKGETNCKLGSFKDAESARNHPSKTQWSERASEGPAPTKGCPALYTGRPEGIPRYRASKAVPGRRAFSLFNAGKPHAGTWRPGVLWSWCCSLSLADVTLTARCRWHCIHTHSLAHLLQLPNGTGCMIQILSVLPLPLAEKGKCMVIVRG